jgi:membrane protease YdiL (CAAX protease family)
MVLTGVLFGMFHGSLHRLLPTTILGVMMSFIAWRSGSILPAMLAHFLNNAILVVLARVGPGEGIEEASAWIQILAFSAALLVAAAGVWLLVTGPRRGAPRTPRA